MIVEYVMFFLCCIVLLLAIILRPKNLLSAFLITLPLLSTGIIGCIYFAKKLGWL